jgi:hypothetical protein
MRFDFLIYPALQGPVLTDAQRPEAITADRVLQPLSLPPGRLNARRAAGLAVALMAAGQVMSPNDLPNTGQTVDMYNFGWAEPVRVKPRLITAANDHHGFVQAAPFDETVLPNKYWLPLAEPVRVKPRLATPSQSSAVVDPGALLLTEAGQLDKFLFQLSEPVRVKPSLRTALQQTFTIAPTALQLAEQVTQSRWHQPWSEPRRYLDSIAQRRTLVAALQQVEPLNPFGVTQPESVRIDKFLLGLSEPVRVKRALRPAAHPFFTISTAAFITPEAVVIDKYLLGLSEPVRLKPGLRVELQVATIIDPFALTLKRAAARSYLIV